MSNVKLEWGSAEVEDARLTVPLDGDLPKGWKQSFETTVTLLGQGDWGEVKLKKGKVQVSDLTAGIEDKLRHHLEAIVAQANAAVGAAEDQPEREADDDCDHDNGGAATRPDAEMTERFKAFAEAAKDPDDAK